MKIEPPADDYGLQKLKQADLAKGQVQQSDQVEKSARIPTTEEHHEARPLTPQPRSRKRRQGKERRRRQEPVILDTRSPHERRTEQRREADQPDTTTTTPTPGSGIDELA